MGIGDARSQRKVYDLAQLWCDFEVGGGMGGLRSRVPKSVCASEHPPARIGLARAFARKIFYSQKVQTMRRERCGGVKYSAMNLCFECGVALMNWWLGFLV